MIFNYPGKVLSDLSDDREFNVVGDNAISFFFLDMPRGGHEGIN